MYAVEIEILGIPSPMVSADNWSFRVYNRIRYSALPDNVHTSVHPGKERLSIVAKLTLTNTQNNNYGN